MRESNPGMNGATSGLELGFDDAQLLGPDLLGGPFRFPTKDQVRQKIAPRAGELPICEDDLSNQWFIGLLHAKLAKPLTKKVYIIGSFFFR